MSITPLQRFFQALSDKISLKTGNDDLTRLLDDGSYSDAADLVRDLLLRSENGPTRFDPLLNMWQASLMQECLAPLLIDDPDAVAGLQAAGITFLEYVKDTNKGNDKFPSRSLFALMTTENDAYREIILSRYNPRLALDHLITSKQPVGCSINDHDYHCDLITRLLDVMQTPADERAIIDYLSRCLPHLKTPGCTIIPELNWGVYLHPKATPVILSWIEENQEYECYLEWEDYVEAEVLSVYDSPFAVMRDMASRGVVPNGDDVIDRVSRIAGVDSRYRHQIGWFLSPFPDLVQDFFGGLDTERQHQMLAFGACHALPFETPLTPAYWAKSRAMVQACFSMLTKDGLSERLAKEIIDHEFDRPTWPNMSWSIPIAIQSYPEHFLHKTVGTRNWNGYDAAAESMAALSVSVEPVRKVTEEFMHAGARISLGAREILNPLGIYFHCEKTHEDYAGLKAVLRQYLDRAINADLDIGEEFHVQPRSERKIEFLQATFRTVKSEKAMLMLAFNLLDEDAERVALSNQQTANLMDVIGNRDEIMAKMSPDQLAEQLTHDLGL